MTYKKNEKAILAKMLIEKENKEKISYQKSYGEFKNDNDYFESNRNRMIHDFQNYTLDDDLYILQNRDELI